VLRNPLRQHLKDGGTTYGLWVTLESPAVTEIAVTLGLDWVCIDMEHGHLGFREVLEHVRAVRGSATAALVRVPEIGESPIKRALDLGAHGVLLPLIRHPSDVEAGFSYARYPPCGVRGVGGERAVKWGLGLQDYLACANEETLVIPIIETCPAADDLLRSGGPLCQPRPPGRVGSARHRRADPLHPREGGSPRHRCRPRQPEHRRRRPPPQPGLPHGRPRRRYGPSHPLPDGVASKTARRRDPPPLVLTMFQSCDTMTALAAATAHGQTLFAKNCDRTPRECQPLVQHLLIAAPGTVAASHAHGRPG